MGGGGKNAASREASLARAEEEARQARIREGTANINRIFDGGSVATGRLGADAAFDPTKTYYRADGSVWTPPKGFGAPAAPTASGAPAATPGGLAGALMGGTKSAAPKTGSPSIMGLNLGTALGSKAPSWQDMLKEGLYSGVEQKGGFDDNFFSGIRKSFVDFAKPQVDDQFRKAGAQSTFGLARSGLLDSSVRGEQNAELQKQYDINLQDINDKARGYETESRNNVERTRADLISMLQATGDATGAANAALTRASTLATPPSYSPLGQLFQDSTAMIGQQLAQERAFALGLAPRPRDSVRAPGQTGGSVKVT